MALGVASRIARRELRGGLKGFRIFLACLILGIAAIAAVGSVRAAIEAGLSREGARLLGGDIEVQFTYRYAQPQERAALEALGDVSEIVKFNSMAVVERPEGTERTLTRVKGIDDAHPLYGAVTLDPPMPLDAALAGPVPGAVMERVLMDRLGLSVGDTFRLGTQNFRLAAAIVREPDSASAFSLGPRTIVRAADLAGSGLLQPGTLFETEYRVRLPEGADLDAAIRQAEPALTQSGARWRDRRNGAPGLSEFVDRLAAFLVLVGLAGLAVGGVGIASAVRAHLASKTATIAVLKTLGASGATIFQVYALQIGALTLLGLVLGLGLGAVLPLAFAPLIEARLPIPAEVGLYPGPLAEAALYGILAAALFTLWPLARAQDVRAAALFRGALDDMSGLPRLPFIAAIVAILAVLVGASAILSGLPKLALSTAGGLGGAFVTLVGVAWLARHAARALARLRAVRGRTALRMALGSVGGPGSEALSVILSLGLGLTVLATIGQIDANLRGAIQRDLPAVAPSYFVLDIQPDQIDGFAARLDDAPGVERVETAPMLRGIFSRINGRPAVEVAGNHWALEGDRGVTYSDRPTDQTVVTQGEWWPEDYDGPPQISFAAETGAEMGLKLGDTLTVNILGRDITGTITSFRDVDFSSAGIGFILSMNPAALQGAPHTFIATIYADEAAEAAILRDLADAYPNITAVRVRDAIDQVTDILAGIAAAITYGASATLVTGAVVLLGAAAAGVPARTFEAAVLRTVGASRLTVLGSFALRWALLGLAAGLVAVAAGALAGWAVSRFVMDTDYLFAPLSALAIVGGGVIGTMACGLAFAWPPLAARPATVLRAQE
ncbi:ABC transporter, permease protein [Oceaniovalibus guishaninsula JLT2003]|uniref:ABC transporter, permease protein n=1 Tax=Oceaniovalibus guishaninsula JLT2003 TaxID=1231392 RepID=K2GPZ1_9RHOB|nr:FtsX-like permease family protein [Oceaniovalibus guishaninsula]EKE44716.1 ABC transporter, permease protein [Oceaniovalibus guishaninsula JLT2003]